jgi:hypothetical protein
MRGNAGAHLEKNEEEKRSTNSPTRAMDQALVQEQNIIYRAL